VDEAEQLEAIHSRELRRPDGAPSLGWERPAGAGTCRRPARAASRKERPGCKPLRTAALSGCY